MTKEQMDAVADAIVDDLFTSGRGNRADRLLLIQESAGGLRRELGGWSARPVRDRVLEILQRLCPPA